MVTRAIVTSHPVVACDVCGRRLLRGENPDVFIAGGRRRTVCELCVPRAAAEGWMREADNHALAVRPGRARRSGSLFGRLRQLREPAERPLLREGLTNATEPPVLADEELYDFLEGGAGARAEDSGHELYIGSVEAGKPVEDDPFIGSVTSGDLKVERAIEVFNAGEPPRRVAGVARSLGVPSVSVRPLEQAGGRVAIVVAWELCWYRYEVDLADEAAGPQLVAQGLELDELSPEDRLANARVDEHGALLAL